MLPRFPAFKKLELTDRVDIELITLNYPPYSDFNFVSMWSWDIRNNVLISELNGNLVVKFTHYLTGESFYSYLGQNKTTETALMVLDLSAKEGLGNSIKLVPHDSISGLDLSSLQIFEDRDNFDYIILIDHLKDYKPKKLYSRRKEVNSLLKRFTLDLRPIDLSQIDIQKKIFHLIAEKAAYDNKVVDNEKLAISRLITGHKKINILAFGIFIAEELVAFCFSEALNNNYATSHFWKANTKISQSLYAYLMQEKAKLLHKDGFEFLNIEQDLGLDNLRKWKESYGTELFLKKFIVTKI